MSGEFEGKVAIVTGAARGIGRAIALALAAQGASVAVVDINASQARATADEIGPGALAVAADVTRAGAVVAMVEDTITCFGRLDIVVNNAGICERVSVEDLTEAQWERTLAVNLKGPFLVSQAAIPHLKAQRAGRIINVASIAGKMGGLMVGLHYSASKGGLLAMTMGLARELAPHNITVNAVCPAMADTEMGQLFAEEEKANYLRSVPLRRLARPEDVAGAVRYLASEAAAYVTGEVIDVNGGVLMD